MTVGVIAAYLVGLTPIVCPILSAVKTINRVTPPIEVKTDPPRLLKQKPAIPFFRHLFKLQINMVWH